MSAAPPIFTLREGGSPLVVSIPHAGMFLPPAIAARLTEVGQAVPDTDFHVDRLYGFLDDLDVTVLVATHSRYAVDLNRSPAGGKLYPGQAETGICPTETFAGAPLYRAAPPDEAEIAARVAAYWQPYHDALRGQIARLRAAHGVARVLDAHSIHGAIPRLFAGALPDLNLGTHDGASCDPALAAAVMAAMDGHGFSTVLNGRFKGGYITRHYGAPADGVQVLQLEMAWRAYLDEARPWVFEPERAATLISVLRLVVAALGGSGQRQDRRQG
jgi:N-formylglutamate deformylase